MLRLEIISPKEQIVSTDAFEVVLPTESGEVGILTNHIPLITHMKMGILSVFNDGTAVRYVVSVGFAQVKADKVSVLTDDALLISELDSSEIESKIQALEAQIAEEASTELKKTYVSQLEFFQLQQSLVAHS